MKQEINLTVQTTEKKVLGKAFIFSLGLFFIVFIIAISLVSYSLLLKSNAKAREEEASKLRSQISTFSKQKETRLVINERLASIKKLLSSRKQIDTRVDTITASIPDNFGVESIKASDKLISITIASPILSDFDSFLEGKLASLTKEKNIPVKTINIGSFSQKSGQYLLSLDFYFVDPKQVR